MCLMHAKSDMKLNDTSFEKSLFTNSRNFLLVYE